MYQQIEKAAKVGSIIVNATMLGVEVYRYFHNNGTQPPHAETVGAE